MAGKKIGNEAIVIGAGMAGLAAAGALADYFERVIMLERDCLQDQAMPRPGTPQSRHLHGLLSGGQRALTDLFPHFERDLVNAGAVPLRVLGEIRAEIPGLGPVPSRDFGWFFYSASRPLIELITRRQAKRLTNLTVRSGYRVHEIIATADGSTVTGVRCESSDGRQEILAADFVGDACGHGLAIPGDHGNTAHSALLKLCQRLAGFCSRLVLQAHPADAGGVALLLGHVEMMNDHCPSWVVDSVRRKFSVGASKYQRLRKMVFMSIFCGGDALALAIEPILSSAARRGR